MEHDKSKLTALNVWAVAFGGVVGWGAFIMPGTMFLQKAGPMGSLIAIEAAALVMFVFACNYHSMLRRLPSSAGPYAWTKAAFGRRGAIFCVWFQILAYLVLVPQNSTALAVLGRILFRTTFQTGWHYRLGGYDIYSAEILLSEAAIVAFGLLNMLPIRVAGKAQTAFALLLGGGLCVMLAGSLLSSKVSGANFHPLFHPGENALLGISSVLSVAPWAFIGFDVIPHLVDDFSAGVSGKSKVIMDMSILCGGLAYVLLIFMAVAALPEEFANWVEYADELPYLHRIIAIPTFYAAWDMMGTLGLTVLGLAALGAIFTGILGFYMVSTRLLRALALEGVLPAWFGRVNRYNAPSNATLFVMGVSTLAPFFGRAVLGWLVDMSSVGAAVAFACTSLAAWKSARQDGRAGVEGRFFGALGFLFAAVFMLLLLIPGLDSSLSRESWACLLLWGLMGAVFVVASRKHAPR